MNNLEALDAQEEETPLCTRLQEGILLVDKPEGKTSFSLVRALRRITGIQKIGHAGTLDPFATGVMVYLIGKNYTSMSDQLLSAEKEYIAKVCLGVTTDTYDCDGKIMAQSKKKPSTEAVIQVLSKFHGEISQTPPMYSAKKIGGKKLYELARKGITIGRPASLVSVRCTLLEYSYPYLSIQVSCSKGTYIRSLASDLGTYLGCGAHLCELQRVRSGLFTLQQCINGSLLFSDSIFDISPYLIRDLTPWLHPVR